MSRAERIAQATDAWRQVMQVSQNVQAASMAYRAVMRATEGK